jgi:hypothetical protein
MPTARSSALRARFDALRAVPQPIAPSTEYEAGSGSGGSGTPDIVPATAVTELTSAHLDWLRPHFFLGGRWSASQAQQQTSEDRGDGGAPPVPLQLDRTTFCALLSKVLILGPRSMLAVFATVEVSACTHTCTGRVRRGPAELAVLGAAEPWLLSAAATAVAVHRRTASPSETERRGAAS